MIWLGNFKCYCLSGDEIFDKNSLNVVDSVMGFFVENVYSYWLIFVDGSEVSEGGVVSCLGGNWNIYVFNDMGSIVRSVNELYENNMNIMNVDFVI